MDLSFPQSLSSTFFFFPLLSPFVLSYLSPFCYSLLFLFDTLLFSFLASSSFPPFSVLYPSFICIFLLCHFLLIPFSFPFVSVLFFTLSLCYMPLFFSSLLSPSRSLLLFSFPCLSAHLYHYHSLLSFQFPSLFPVLPCFSSCLLPPSVILSFIPLLPSPSLPSSYISPSLLLLSLTLIPSWY